MISAEHFSKKKRHGMVIFCIELTRTYRKLSSQADPMREIELEVIHILIKTDASH